MVAFVRWFALAFCLNLGFQVSLESRKQLEKVLASILEF